MLHVWICACIFLSGLSALIYEVAWLRVLGLILGSSAVATSIALSVFLLGLAWGAYMGGRVADKHPGKPLRLYGCVELLIGFSALVVTPALMPLPEMLLSVSTRHALPSTALAQIALFSVVLLIPPTMLMGATLPLVLKQVAAYTQAQKTFGLIYGLNTLGAVFGSLIAAFVGFSYLGLSGTIVLAAAINSAIGVGSLIIPIKNASRKGKQEPSGSSSLEESPLVSSSEDPATVTEPPFPVGVVSLLAFASGYLSLSLEVVWVRLLRFYNGSLTYSFSIMISTFLLGLALGSFIFDRWIFGKDRTVSDQIFRFVKLQYLGAMACAGCLIGIPIAMVLKNFGLVPTGVIFFSPVKSLLELTLTSIACILLPATLLGILFPVLGALSSSAKQNMASRVGLVYAANTLGCVCGSLLTGLVLVPAIGSYDSFQVALLFAVLCSGFAVLKLDTLQKNRRLLLAGVPAALALFYCLFVKYPFSRFIHFPPPQKLLFYGEDATGIMFIVHFPNLDAKQLTVNGSCLATTILPSRRYMRLLGHLPMLLNPEAKDVLVACFGTGTTCGAVSVHPSLNHLRVVELSPLIVKNGSFFSDSNHHVLENPKTHVHVGDARHFLLQNNRVFDVISMEPPPPADAGMVNLYTTEFYRMVADHLTEDGVFGQWVPIHEQPEQVWKMMLASAVRAFPHVSVWLPNSGEALLMSSKRPIKFDADYIRRQMEIPAVRNSLEDVGITKVEDLLACFVFADEPLKEYVGSSEDVTDDRPRLEFFLPYIGEFMNDEKLLALRKEETLEKAGSIDRRQYEVSRDALVLSMTWKGDSSQLQQKLEQMMPGNKFFRFLRVLENTR